MNTLQFQPNRVGIQKVTSPIMESDDPLAVILRDVIQTREVRQLIITVVPEFLNAWAGRSWWKRMISKMAGVTVNNQLSKPEDALGNNEIELLLENERFIRNVSELLPPAINTSIDAICAGIRNIESFSAEDKKKLFEDLFSQTGKGRTGALLTNCARILTDIHKVDPEFLANTLEPGITQWLEAMDFGELKEAVDNSGQGALAFVEMVNNVIWQYPSKVISILSLLPSIVNMILGSLQISLEKMNAMSPDLLTDIIISLLGEIDGKAVAGLVDELTEIARKLHTGSALIGEPGSPQLPKALSEKLNEIVSQTDAATFWKGKIALAEIKDAFDQALSDATNNDPEYSKLAMIKGPELYNIGIRAKNRKLSAIEAMDDQDLEQSMKERLSAYDVQQTAEIFNNFLLIANRVWEQNPVVCYEFISQFVNGIDSDELAGMARQIFQTMGEELRPTARAVIPGLVEWVCDVLRPEDDEHEDDAERARKALQSLFMTEEV